MACSEHDLSWVDGADYVKSNPTDVLHCGESNRICFVKHHRVNLMTTLLAMYNPIVIIITAGTKPIELLYFYCCLFFVVKWLAALKRDRLLQ